MTRTQQIRDYLAAYVAQAREEEGRLVAEGAPEGSVHDARVAVRRVRSLLRTFPGLAPAERRESVEDRLRAWSRLLGAVRDLEVLRETLAEVCGDDLLARAAALLDRDEAEAWTRLRAELVSADHRALMAELEALAVGEPTGALHPRRRARKAERRADKRLSGAGDDPEALHRARRAAKRARYAAEAVGDDAVAAHHKSVQDALGRHHDCMVAAQWLAESGLPADEEVAAREELLARAAEALRSLS